MSIDKLASKSAHIDWQSLHLDDGGRFALVDYSSVGGSARGAQGRRFRGRVLLDSAERTISGQGNGPISALLDALQRHCGLAFDVADYQEHAIGAGGSTRAAAYVECRLADGRSVFGVGIDADSTAAAVKAVLSAANGAVA